MLIHSSKARILQRNHPWNQGINVPACRFIREQKGTKKKGLKITDWCTLKGGDNYGVKRFY